MSLRSYLLALPKVELHVHLEGAILPATLLTLANRNRVTLPVETVEEVQRWFTYRDFDHFADVYDLITRCFRTSDDYELVAYEFGAEMARQHIQYAEVTFSPSTHAFGYGVPFATYFDGLTRGRERAEREWGIRIRWVFDIMRTVADPTTLHPKASYVTGVAIDGLRDGVVALGLGGDEANGPRSNSRPTSSVPARPVCAALPMPVSTPDPEVSGERCVHSARNVSATAYAR